MLLLNKLLWNFTFLKQITYLEGLFILPLMVQTFGCFLRAIPGQRDGVCEMENSSPSQTPGVQETDFQSWLSSEGKKGRVLSLGEKNAAYFRACLIFHPLKCSWQVLLVLSCRLLLLRGLLSVVTVVKGSGASQGTTISGYILEDQLCQRPHLLPSGADVWAPVAGNGAREAKTQQPRLHGLWHILHIPPHHSSVLGNIKSTGHG